MTMFIKKTEEDIEHDEIINLLGEREETDRLDFKQKWKLFYSLSEEGKQKINKKERDELIKDILGLVNGNSHIVKKNKYLIVGADDKAFGDDGSRVLYDVDYRVPTASEITQWVNGACTPSVVGIEADFLTIKEKKYLCG
mgnify:CR=1 FL=1